MAAISTKFVDLVLKYKLWNQVVVLPDREIDILLRTVTAAGFSVREVVPGKAIGYFYDEYTRADGKMYFFNSFSHLKAIDQSGKDHYFATGWLDCALRRIVCGWTIHKQDRQMIVGMMEAEIERSVPLKPIPLNNRGDTLKECVSPLFIFELEFFVNHPRDNCSITNSCVGIHDDCEGYMDRIQLTKHEDAICCRKCHLRVCFPAEVKTYGELRQTLNARQAA